jgi:TM2 domain-containing membrane protein YozV
MGHWRKMTWTIWAWTLLCGLWLGVGIGSVANSKPNCNGLSTATCQAAANVGAGIGGFSIFVVWILVFLVLSVIWFMTRSRGRTCPRCGENVRKGQTKCGKCGYDYVANLPAGGSTPG